MVEVLTLSNYRMICVEHKQKHMVDKFKQMILYMTMNKFPFNTIIRTIS